MYVSGTNPASCFWFDELQSTLLTWLPSQPNDESPLLGRIPTPLNPLHSPSPLTGRCPPPHPVWLGTFLWSSFPRIHVLSCYFIVYAPGSPTRLSASWTENDWVISGTATCSLLLNLQPELRECLENQSQTIFWRNMVVYTPTVAFLVNEVEWQDLNCGSAVTSEMCSLI